MQSGSGGGSGSGGADGSGGTGVSSSSSSTGSAGCYSACQSCPGAVCTGLPPSGWMGPVALYMGPYLNLPCVLGAPGLSGVMGPTGADAICNACTCGNEPCDKLTVEVFQSQDCTGSGTKLMLNDTTGCAKVVPSELTWSVQMPQILSQGGTCTPAGGGVAMKPTANLGQYVALCNVVHEIWAHCLGAACVIPPQPPFDPRLCIYQPGSLACPAPYNTKVVEFGTLDDTRDCSACTCGAPAATCDASVTFHSDDMCVNLPSGMAASNNMCSPFPGGAVMVSSLSIGAPSPCTPSLSVPIGSVGIANPITVCCE